MSCFPWQYHVAKEGNDLDTSAFCFSSANPFRGPEGFPICDGYDPKSLPDELGVWQVIEDQADKKFGDSENQVVATYNSVSAP